MNTAIRALYQSVPGLRNSYRALRRFVARPLLRWTLRQSTARGQPLRIVVGAGRKCQPGWIATEQYNLDVVDEYDWMRYFQPESVQSILAEHVWEHLTEDHALLAARLCRRYLKSGGHLRVAVPDAFFPSVAYYDYCRPGGCGPSAWDHKVFYNHRTLAEIFIKSGLRVVLLEWYDEQGVFHTADWSIQDGYVRRSSKGNERNPVFDGKPYSSLILDAERIV